MFTGIITGVGQIVDSQPLGAEPSHGRRLTLQTPAGYLEGVGLGDSIAINGACMTVTTFDAAAGRFTIDVSAESLARTVGLTELGRVNLEQALRSHDRLGRFLAFKGSITVNGVSLTVNQVVDLPDGQTEFDINLIPHTIDNTALGSLKAGGRVNLEVDLIARYVERMLGAEGKLAG